MPVVKLLAPVVNERDVPWRGVALLARILETVESERDVRRVVQTIAVGKVGRSSVKEPVLNLYGAFVVGDHAADYCVSEGVEVFTAIILEVALIDDRDLLRQLNL